MPVSLVTGFLGSGKTTLLNALLRHPGMGDSAVIVNEFGEIGLDHLLIEAVSGEVAVLANGCVCCTVRSDLADTIRRLLAQRDAGEVPPFRRVLIETTGLADPAPIVQMLLNNPLVSHFARLDAVVTTVDAVHAGGQLDAHGQAVKQVALADRLLLTKTDLAGGGPLLDRLRAINPAAPVIPVRHGDIAPDQLFGAALFDPERKTPDVRRWLAEEAYHDHDHEHHDHAHAAGIDSFCLTFAQPLDWLAVSQWLSALRSVHGPALLRVKGILNLHEEPGPVAIHGVHHVFHPPVRLEAWSDADRRSRIVFITQGLPRAQVQEAAAAYGL
ncbi:MAG: GTP-binding protein [Acetobacteraceae bacterium]